MIIKLPKSVRFPITITELLRHPNDDVARLDPLLVYTYKTKIMEYPEYGVEVEVEKELSSQFDAPVAGKLAKWLVKLGTVVENNRFVSGLYREKEGSLWLTGGLVLRSSRLKSPAHMRFNSRDCVRCAARI